MTLLALSAVFVFTSCTEDDNTVEEYPNWKETNVSYFDELYTTTQDRIAAGDTSWKIIRAYNLPADDDDKNVDPSSPYKVATDDNIVVHVLNEGTGAGCPLYTDSVKVHYLGRLLPSTSYPEGYIFDRSYYSDYDLSLMTPVTMAVSSLTSGFATALQNMHVGDRWMVYVPSALAYGDYDTSSIPASSVLIFDITLVSYFRPWADTSAKPMSVGIGGEWIE